MKPIEEQPDNLGFDQYGNPVKPDLNQYASTIAMVFKKLAPVMYDDGCGDSGNDVVCDLSRVLDADTCGEIISVAQAVEEQG